MKSHFKKAVISRQGKLNVYNSNYRSCHGAHTRREQEHTDEDINSNDNI